MVVGNSPDEIRHSIHLLNIECVGEKENREITRMVDEARVDPSTLARFLLCSHQMLLRSFQARRQGALAATLFDESVGVGGDSLGYLNHHFKM